MARTPGSTSSPAALVLAARGITQARLAARLGVSTGAVTRYLGGSRTPPPELIPAIRALMGVDAAAEVAAILGIEDTR